MSHHVINLELPEDVFAHVARAARGMKQPVETALVSIVRGATPSLEKVPLAYRADLEALEDLSDEELSTISASRLAQAKQRHLEKLLERNERGELTKRDRQALTRLRGEVDRLMLLRSFACLLLKYRGHRIPSQRNVK